MSPEFYAPEQTRHMRHIGIESSFSAGTIRDIATETYTKMTPNISPELLQAFRVS